VDSSGIITTVAGDGFIDTFQSPPKGRFAGDNGLATKASLSDPASVFVALSGDLYIADTYNGRIRKVDAAGIISTVAGGGSDTLAEGKFATNVTLSAPSGLFVDRQNNLYFVDSHQVWMINATGVLKLVAGDGYHDPNVSAFGRFAGDGGPATQASLYSPSNVFIDGAGDILIADSFNNRIRKVDSSGIITTVAGNGERGFSAPGIPAGDASFNNPRSVFVDGAGDLYFSDTQNHRVCKVDASGLFTVVAGNGERGFSGDGGPAAEANLALPVGVFVDEVGHLYIGDIGNRRVRRVEGIATPTIVPSPATRVEMSSLDLSINQGYVLANGLGESQLRVRLLDSSGNLLSGDNSTPVSLEVIQGVASISGPNPATASGGVAISNVGRTSTAGMVVVWATAAGFAADTDTLFAVSARKLRLSIAQDYILANGIGESQMSAELLDQDNRVIFTEDRAAVTFTVSGPASVVGAPSVAVQRGVAQGTLRSQTQEGWAVVTASAEGFTSSTDSVWIGNPVEKGSGRAAILAFVDKSHQFWPYIQRDVDMLDSLGVSYDLIQPQELDSQILANYRLLIIPTVWAEYPWQTSTGNAAIVDFVSNGGGLVVTEAGYGGSSSPSFFPYPLTIDAGWAVEGTATIPDPSNPIVSGLRSVDFSQYADSRVTSRDPHWRQVVAVGGQDAIVYCEYGTGFALYTGYQVFPGTPESQWYVNLVRTAVTRSDQSPSRPPTLRIKGFAGVRQASSPLRTRVGRSLRFEVWAFSAPDSSDLRQITDYTWQVPSHLGTSTSLGRLDLTTVAGVDDSITFQAQGGRAIFRIITTPLSVDRLVVTPAELTIAPRNKQTFRAQAFDQYGNVVFGKNFGWHAVGGIGTIDPHTGDFTAADQPGEGYVIAVVSGEMVFGDAAAAIQGISKIVVKPPLPEQFSLHQNTPNPFNPATEIEFDLPVESQVRLNVYNLSGQLVEKLVDQICSAGVHRVQWKGVDLPSGVYLYRLEAGSFRMQRKMTLLR
jgi:hypothetical protein